MTAPGPSQGAGLLGAIVAQHGPREVGRRLGASESAVRSWTKGHRSPTGAARRQLSEVFAIPTESWGTAVAPSPPAKDAATVADVPTPAASTTSASASARERAVDQVHRIEAEIANAKEKGAGWRDLAALERTYTSALRNLGRLSGELEVSESQILRSAAWARVRRVLDGLLDRHPTVARELATAIDQIGGEA